MIKYKEYMSCSQLTKPHGGNARNSRATDYKNQAADRLAMLMDMALQNVYRVPRQKFVPVAPVSKPLSMIEKLQLIDNEVRMQLEKCKNNCKQGDTYANKS